MSVRSRRNLCGTVVRIGCLAALGLGTLWAVWHASPGDGPSSRSLSTVAKASRDGMSNMQATLREVVSETGMLAGQAARAPGWRSYVEQHWDTPRTFLQAEIAREEALVSRVAIRSAPPARVQTAPPLARLCLSAAAGRSGVSPRSAGCLQRVAGTGVIPRSSGCAQLLALRRFADRRPIDYHSIRSGYAGRISQEV